MNYKVGYKVRYLNDVGGGVITKVIDKRMVEIEDENGFVVPVLKTELVVVDEEAMKNTTDTPKEIESYVENNSYNYADRDQWDYLEQDNDQKKSTEVDIIKLMIAFVPDNFENSVGQDINLFVINDSSYHLLFSISTEDGFENILLDAGSIAPNTKVYISTYKRDDLSNIKTFNIQSLFYKSGYFKLREPITKDFKIKPAKFYKENLFTVNDYFNNDAYIIDVYKENESDDEQISKEQVRKLLEQKRNEDTIKKSNHKFKKLKNTEQIEIDLHIEKIIDDFVGMSNGEIINIQLNHFRKHMETAIVNKVKRIVFIHGIGNGTLKYELRKILDEEYHEHAFQDASFKEYGYGATMVILK
jgi:hypothetical protein